jgi:hypothetical protein
VIVREAAGAQRVLGTGRLEGRPGGEIQRATRVELTELGQELTARPGGVAATIALPDYSPRPIGWTVRLER